MSNRDRRSGRESCLQSLVSDDPNESGDADGTACTRAFDRAKNETLFDIPKKWLQITARLRARGDSNTRPTD
jgi:hypothetical protein